MGAAVRSDWGYRPHLDGVRTLAVYLVVAFHAGLVRFDGGFIGVDVFFVLSGYLVTSLLTRDVASFGAVRFGQFYSRRIRRLLPAAVVNLTVTAVVFAAIASPVEAAGAVGAVRAAALYVANWYFIGQSADYFARNITSSPVIHYWSLSVEEQFYFLWPLLLSGLVLAGRRLAWTRGRMVQIGVVVIGLTSLVWALALARTDPNRAYLATYARAYQLLAGAWLALTPGAIARARRAVGRRVLPWVSVAALLALLGLATSAVDVGPITRGVATTIATLVLLVSLEAADGGIGRRLLSVRPIVYLGRISYGTYLWHWLVIIVLVDAYHPSPLVAFVVAACVASAIASLSYELIEMPIRTARVLDSARSRVIAVGLVASVLVAAVVAPAALRGDSGRAATVAASGRAGTPNHADWRAAVDDIWNYEDLHGKKCASLTFYRACPITVGHHGSIALVGDSHAGMLVPMFADLARRHDLTLTVIPLLACPWTRGVRYANANPGCVTLQGQVFDKMVPRIDPDIVVLAHRPVDDPTNGEPLRDDKLGGNLTTSASRRQALRQSIDGVVTRLRADGPKVVMIEPIPVPPVGDDPLACLSKATVLEQCRFIAPAGPLPEERIMRRIARSSSGVWSLDLDRQICPFLPICDPVVDGLVPRLDDNHITVTFGRTLRPAVEQFLETNGILTSTPGTRRRP